MKMITNYFNCKIYSMDGNKIYHAMQIENDKIVGLSKENYQKKYWHNIDLNGKYILPGFIDTHTHSFEGGLYSLGADLSDVESISELLEVIRFSKPIGGMLFAFHFDENKIKEKRFPTITELNKVAPDLPLLLRKVDGHSCTINSSAKKLIFGENDKSITKSEIFYKEMNDHIAHFFHKKINLEGIEQAYHNTAKIGIENGLTTIHTMIGDANKDPLHFKWMQENLDKFELEYILYPQILDVDKAIELGANRVGGCILADGSFGSHTAGLFNSYSDRKNNNGNLYQSNEFWIDFVRKAHNNNLQVGVHAIGDAAIEQILTAYELAQKENPKDLRHEIIHCELTSDEQIERMAKAKVSAVMQPMFDRLWGGEENLYNRVLGKERTKRTTRLNSIKSAGILLTGGSDFYITDLNPIKGIDAAERIHNSNESLNREDAIKMYTINAAKLSNDQNRIGSLKIDKQADFIVTENDPMTIKSFLNLNIKNVYKRGFKIK